MFKKLLGELQHFYDFPTWTILTEFLESSKLLTEDRSYISKLKFSRKSNNLVILESKSQENFEFFYKIKITLRSSSKICFDDENLI